MSRSAAVVKALTTAELEEVPDAECRERLARLLDDVADSRIADQRVRISGTRVFETLHPVDAIAEYAP